MVGSLLLLKILHCKRYCQKAGRHTEENQSTSNGESLPQVVKTEIQENQPKICRICLKDGDIPIYGNNDLEDISDVVNIFGDINVEFDDSYPKFLCDSCNSLLQGAILFRKTAQQSEELLKHPIKPPLPDVHDETSRDYEDDDHQTFDNDIKIKEQDNYHCSKCDIDFKTFKEFSEHKLTPEHENMRRTCPICNKSYVALYYKKHLALHKRETPYMCDICGKKFIIQGQFTRHRLTHFYHLPFKCSLCPYRGRFTESLKMHMRSHTGEKPYQCTQCAHRFVNKSNLNKHLLTHKGDHDFICSSCGRGFYTQRDLDLHYKVDHTGLKDHVCNICGKAFGYRKQMMKHQLKVHKREKLRSGRTPLYLIADNTKQQDGEVQTSSQTET